MSYQVLARKWRPRTFVDLVGQAHVVRPLVHALDQDRLHHAFLFTGTRGVGKTTIARILAKSLNCETGVSSKPCGQCSACREVDEGRFIDLIEVDAASRTKVDDTRELLDNVQYAPTRGRYKVYLIDEVHMLSGHSFNALLKTLEEPPPHVKFLLATTDPQKLPVTVLSRCLQFGLKRLSPEEIASQLEKILAAETIAADAGAIALLARAADGSLRDGLSLLDQAIAYGGGQVSETEVRAMLGTVDQDAIDRTLRALAAGDAPAALAVVADLVNFGLDCESLLDELLLALHRLALVQVDEQLVEAAERERWLAHARAMRPEDIQLYYQIGLHGRRDLAIVPDPRTGVEMTLLRMIAFRPVDAEAANDDRAPNNPGPTSTPSNTPAKAQATGTATATKSASPSAAPPPPAATAPTPAPVATPAAASTDWSQVVGQLKLQGLVRELANNAVLETQTEDGIALVLDQACGQLLSKEREASLKQALEAYYGRPMKLTVRLGKPPTETPVQEKNRVRDEQQQAAVQAINSDPNVRALREQFNAQVSPETIRPKSNARQS